MTIKILLIRGVAALICLGAGYLIPFYFPIERNMLINLGFIGLLIFTGIYMMIGLGKRDIAYGIFYGLIGAVLISIVQLLQKLSELPPGP